MGRERNHAYTTDHAIHAKRISNNANSNGFILYAAGKPVPKEFMRVPTGTSIAEPGSIIDEESGRMYHNHHSGRYFFPNDPVRYESKHAFFKSQEDSTDQNLNSSTSGRAGSLRLTTQPHHPPIRPPTLPRPCQITQKCPRRRHRHRHLGHQLRQHASRRTSHRHRPQPHPARKRPAKRVLHQGRFRKGRVGVFRAI